MSATSLSATADASNESTRTASLARISEVASLTSSPLGVCSAPANAIE